MPVFIAAIGGALISLVGTLVGRVLIALGISVVTFTGLSTSLDWMTAQAITAFSGLPAEMFSLIAYMKVGVCISIVTSAISARMLINGISGDTFKRWVLK
ncbi:MAG: cobalt ABC transporter permease [Comamonas sp. SCN 65-56]|uniref:DUF2523 domain-containing protein n=1 Tax=Comamonas sp. SCN 65-56 TaxID=1660095 RepID=UPI00086E5C10|nr:DUF2523 domain-containing protein [Comamonas sp. SCN 65-56]ODS92291.1 MAG: cobalt ABC transporter permease [Comamonas sp. SCN 65-56]